MKKVGEIYWPWPNLAEIIIAIGSLYKNIFLNTMLISAIISFILNPCSRNITRVNNENRAECLRNRSFLVTFCLLFIIKVFERFKQIYLKNLHVIITKIG